MGNELLMRVNGYESFFRGYGKATMANGLAEFPDAVFNDPEKARVENIREWEAGWQLANDMMFIAWLIAMLLFGGAIHLVSTREGLVIYSPEFHKMSNY